MSYQKFKQVLGESNIERKCLWWFGASLILMLFLSFHWFGRQNTRFVFESKRELGRELARTAWLDIHFWLEDKFDARLHDADVTAADPRNDDARFYRDVLESSRSLGTAFRYYSILRRTR
jgi:two-component system, NarL family, sensor histidine kinase BarA